MVNESKFWEQNSFGDILSQEGQEYVRSLIKDRLCTCGKPLALIQSFEGSLISCQWFNLGDNIDPHIYEWAGDYLAKEVQKRG